MPNSLLNGPLELEDIFAQAYRPWRTTFRIALLVPMCGSAGIWGPSCISSAQVAIEELNRDAGINGKPVDLLVIDAAMEAQTSVEDIIEGLIEDEAIDAIVGMHISAIRQRLRRVVRQRIPYIYTPLYEGGESTAGVFSIGETPREQLGPSLEFLQRRYRPTSWALIGNDYVWPRMSHLFAKAKLTGMGTRFVYEKYVPFGAPRMAQLVEEIGKSGAEAVLISLVGQDAVNFNRAFGAAGLHDRIVRLSCAIEENGLLASGAKNSKRMFVASSYFGSLRTDQNAAFKEQYFNLHGRDAPVLNALGQSTYEGVQFLAGLLLHHPDAWRQHAGTRSLPVIYRSGRRALKQPPVDGLPIYLARADGLAFDIVQGL